MSSCMLLAAGYDTQRKQLIPQLYIARALLAATAPLLSDNSKRVSNTPRARHTASDLPRVLYRNNSLK
jgi:hypothetical protein